MNQPSSKGSASGARPSVKLSREFDFPRETVFGMMADSKKAAKWFGLPKGVVRLAHEMDFRPGGAIRLDGRDGDGNIGKTSGTFVEIVVPERIAFKTATTPPNFTTPFEVLQTMTFEALSPRKTRLTVTVEILSMGSFPGSPESLGEGYKGGWGETLEMLQEELLSPS